MEIVKVAWVPEVLYAFKMIEFAIWDRKQLVILQRHAWSCTNGFMCFKMLHRAP